MGLPPAQGHNNLRLTNTGNLYQNHNFRLDTRPINTFKTHHNKHHLPKSMTMPKFKQSTPQIQVNSRPILTSKPLTNFPMLTSILKPSRYQQSRTKHIDNHVQFELNRSALSQRRTPYSYAYVSRPERNTSSTVSNKYHTSDYRNVRFRIPQPSVAKTKEHRSSRYKSRKNSIISNMPLINVNSSVLMVNHSPFGLRDPRFGIFHHCSQSISYF